jgi:uncharacterized protein YqfB (UPF0267 family)
VNSALFVLNFYSPIFVDQLRSGRKTATIRLGDKSRKYKRGQVVWVTIGYRHQARDADAVVLAVNHHQYKGLTVDGLTAGVREGATFVDAFDVLPDPTIVELKKRGFKVYGYGKGHIRYL